MHSQCNTRPTVMFPAVQHHPLSSTKLYWSMCNEDRITWFTSYQTMQNSLAFQPRGLTQNFCKTSTGWYWYLRMVELRQPGSTESLRQLTLDDNIVYIVSQQTMIDVARHGRFIHRKCSQSSLNTTSSHASHDQRIVTVTTLIMITTEALSALNVRKTRKRFSHLCASAVKTWNLLKWARVSGSQPLVSRSSPYSKDMWGRYCCLTCFLSNCRYVP